MLIRAAAAALALCAGLAEAGQVAVNTYKGRAYHHLALDLTRGMLVEDAAVVDPDIGYAFSEGGLFEIYLAPPVPGVAAPGCRAVTVRMPWTDFTAEGAEEKIATKRALFERIAALRGGGPPVAVVLELDPYLAREEGRYRLTECLAFFRQAFGAYVGHDGPLGAHE
jgi:hypothetical protein